MEPGLWDEIEKYMLRAFGQEVDDVVQLPDWTSPQERMDADGSELIPETATRVPLPERHVVNEEVEHLKAMYILGKRVGKDVVHPGGRVIAKRGDRITREVMHACEQAGKLVELIINMTFDRGGEAQK